MRQLVIGLVCLFALGAYADGPWGQFPQNNNGFPRQGFPQQGFQQQPQYQQQNAFSGIGTDVPFDEEVPF